MGGKRVAIIGGLYPVNYLHVIYPLLGGQDLTEEISKSRTSFFFFLRAAPMAHGGSQARGQIRATAMPDP